MAARMQTRWIPLPDEVALTQDWARKGVDAKVIAGRLGKTERQFEKALGTFYRKAKYDGIAEVAGVLFERAKKGSITCINFYLTNVAGWGDRLKVQKGDDPISIPKDVTFRVIPMPEKDAKDLHFPTMPPPESFEHAEAPDPETALAPALDSERERDPDMPPDLPRARKLADGESSEGRLPRKVVSILAR